MGLQHHRMDSGAGNGGGVVTALHCDAELEPLVRADIARYRCAHCGEPCRPIEVDFGHGEVRYPGAVNRQIVSKCCETELEEIE